jgi:hypothetical protein
VSSLPELVFEADSKNFDLKNFKDLVLEEVSINDAELVHGLFYAADNENLLSLLYSDEKEWNPYGKYTRDELEDILRDAESGSKNLPQYLREFFEQLNRLETEQRQRIERSVAEKLLSESMYSHHESCSNKYISSIFKIDREIRNIRAAYAGRKAGISPEKFFVGNDEINDALLKNNASDFGLTREKDYAAELFRALDTSDLQERERKLDLFTWSLIDEINTFEYFSIDAILGFLQKAAIIARWSKLDKATGNEMFKRMIKDLQGIDNKE